MWYGVLPKDLEGGGGSDWRRQKEEVCVISCGSLFTCRAARERAEGGHHEQVGEVVLGVVLVTGFTQRWEGDRDWVGTCPGHAHFAHLCAD